MIHTYFQDEDGSSIELFANEDNKLFITINTPSDLNLSVTLDLEDALLLQRELNKEIKSLKQNNNS